MFKYSLFYNINCKNINEFGISMDEIDFKIVELLRKNGREKFVSIASLLGVSESTVRKRVEKLEQEGIIRGYYISVDARRLGYDVVALILLGVEPQKFLEVVSELSNFKEIEYIATCTGEYTIIFEVWMRNMNDFSKFISEKISKIEGVSKINPVIMLEKKMITKSTS